MDAFTDRNLVAARLALQFSGHLRAACALETVRLHVHACRQRFLRCDVFVHTWTEIEPTTPHWRRGVRPAQQHTNASSAACVARLQAMLGSDTPMQVERQPSPPPADSLAPDGQRFTETGFDSSKKVRLHYGPAREFGWRMNVHGMAQAGRLRRMACARRKLPADSCYDLAVRVRPDDRWRFGTEKQVAGVWDCLVPLFSAEHLTIAARHSHVRGPRRQASQPASTLQTPPTAAAAAPSRRRELFGLSRHFTAGAISSCSAKGGLTSVGQDNCFFARPTLLDALFAPFEDDHSYSELYAAHRRYERLPFSSPELSLIVAAARAGLPLGVPCDPARNYSF